MTDIQQQDWRFTYLRIAFIFILGCHHSSSPQKGQILFFLVLLFKRHGVWNRGSDKEGSGESMKGSRNTPSLTAFLFSAALGCVSPQTPCRARRRGGRQPKKKTKTESEKKENGMDRNNQSGGTRKRILNLEDFVGVKVISGGGAKGEARWLISVPSGLCGHPGQVQRGEISLDGTCGVYVSACI